jgi:electron transport complex protein RnfD
MSEEKQIILPDASKLVVSSSPHVHKGSDVTKIMIHVIIALLPACAVGVYVFGMGALRVLLLTTLFCVLAESLILKIMGKSQTTLRDGSAVLTGILLAMNLSANTPWWACLVGALIAIVIAKQLFGGLGYNPFNPALVARVALLIGFPGILTSWASTRSMLAELPDTLTCATPLALIPKSLVSNAVDATTNATVHVSSNMDLFLGNIPGSLGETSALALLIGGIYLIKLKLIRWQVPVYYIATVALLAIIHHAIDPAHTLTMMQHILSGGLFIGAFFMATDMVTSPETTKGAIVFAIGCGVMTFAIRVWGAYPEGVSFSILFMNAFVPLIDRFASNKPFGRKEAEAL